MQTKRVGQEKTNQKEGRNQSGHRIKKGPAFGGGGSNPTKGGGINRATTGKA